MLRNVDWWYITDISAQRDPSSRFRQHFGNGTDRLSRNVSNLL